MEADSQSLDLVITPKVSVGSSFFNCNKKKLAIFGTAPYNSNYITIGTAIKGDYDVIESYTISKIIVHETLHKTIESIAGKEASWMLDKILQHREYSYNKNGKFRYLQYDKIDIMCD